MENKLTNEQIKDMASICVNEFFEKGLIYEGADDKYHLWFPYVMDEPVEWDTIDAIVADMLSQPTWKDEHCTTYNVKSFDYLKELYRVFCETEERFYDLNKMLFSRVDPNMIFSDGPDDHAIYYFNPDSVAGGQIVECPFDDEMAQRIFDGEAWIDVVAEKPQYLSDINTVHFFDTVDSLMRDFEDEKYVDYAVSDEGVQGLMKCFLEKD